MRLRPFKDCDADTIVSWIKNEKIFRYWCADRFESYPISGHDLIDQYDALAYKDDIFHFTAYDETGIVGHFNIRYPDRNDIDTVRFGYVIVDDTKRGKGLGKQMIKLALDYAVNYMLASKVTLGVFEENEPALNCYLSCGFKDTGITNHYSFCGNDWTCKELVYDVCQTDEDGFSNFINVEEYMNFRRIVGWAEFSLEEARSGLKNSTVYCIRKDNRPIALGRVVQDHGYVVYIADVIVLPEYQGQGLGRKIMEKIISSIKKNLKPDQKVMVSLMAAKGKEEFYEKFGFEQRPTDRFGCGMCQWISFED